MSWLRRLGESIAAKAIRDDAGLQRTIRISGLLQGIRALEQEMTPGMGSDRAIATVVTIIRNYEELVELLLEERTEREKWIT